MYRKVIKYTDYDGNEREGTFYFNLTEAELIKWEGMTTGTLQEKISRMTQTQNQDELIQLFDEVICRAYGEKSVDGQYFRKSAEILDRFKSTPAYSNLFMELATNDEAGADFINGIMPPDLLERMEAAKAEAKKKGDLTVLPGGATKE